MAIATPNNIFDRIGSYGVMYSKVMDRIIAELGDVTPILMELNGRSKSIPDYKVTWKEKFPLPKLYLRTDLSSTGTTGTTALTIVTKNAASKSGEAPYEVQLGDIYEIGTEKIRIITSAPTITARATLVNGYASVTVARGACGTTAAVHAQYAEAKYAGNSSTVDRAHTDHVRDPGYEYSQFVQREVVHDGLDTLAEIVTDVPGGGEVNDVNWLMPVALMKKIEASLVRGEATTPTQSTKWGTFDGILHASTAIAGGLYTAGGITQAQFEAILDDLEAKGMHPTHIYTGLKMSQALNSWYHGEIQPIKETRRNMLSVGQWIPTLTAQPQAMRIIRHRQFSSGEIAFMDMDRAQLYWAGGVKARKQAIANDGGGPRYLMDSFPVLRVNGSKVQGVITNITGYA